MPIELISTFRKKINTSFLIVILLAVLFIAMNIIYHPGNLVVIQVMRIITFFLAIYSFILYERRKNLLSIFKSPPMEIISSFELYLEQKKQNENRHRIIRLILIAVLTIALFVELINHAQDDRAQSIVPLWFAVILLTIAEKWLDMNTHIMLQDLKHEEK